MDLGRARRIIRNIYDEETEVADKITAIQEELDAEKACGSIKRTPDRSAEMVDGRIYLIYIFCGEVIPLQEMTENEKKKEFLRKYRRAVRREREILDEIQRLRADKMFPSVCNDGMPRGSSQTDLSDYMAEIDAAIEDLKEERLKKIKIYREIEMRIRCMKDEDEQEVLRMRYIKGMKWEGVAEKMKYSYRGVLKIHGRALENFEIK